MWEKQGGEGWEQGEATTAPLRAPKGRVVAKMRLEESVRGRIRQRWGETCGKGKGEGEVPFERNGEAGGCQGSLPAPKESIFLRRAAPAAMFWKYLRLK
jgi:hypothetical protein